VRIPITVPLLPDDRAASWWPLVRHTILGAVLVVLFTSPSLPRLTSVGRLDTGDGRLSIWNIGWIDHALTTAPRELVNANIFWPHVGTLMYSELNLVAGLLGLPWFAATGGSSLAALNGAAVTGLVLAFVLMATLVRRLTGSEAAGVVAAIGFTFCPYIHARTAHIQLLMTFVFPLVMLAYHWMAERPGVSRGAVLGGALVISALACSYYSMFGGCALALAAICLAQRSKAYWLALATAAAVAAAAIVPLYLAFSHYRELSGTPFVMRNPDEALQFSANITAYLASATAAHAWWLPALAKWRPWSDVLFPGVGLIALACLGLAAARNEPRQRRLIWTYLAVAALAFWASFGPAAGLYRVLQTILPGMSFLRVASRFGIVVTFALAVIAGFAVASIGRRRRWVPWALGILLACELAVWTPAWGWPSWPLQEALPVPKAYHLLAALPRGALVEFEFPYVRANFHNHTYAMFWSTYHWQPLVNGYTDLIPKDFEEIALPINAFPDPQSFEIMRKYQVRYVLWHTDAYKGATRDVVVDRLSRYEAYLRPIIKDERAWLFEIVGWPPAPNTPLPGSQTQ